MFERKTAEKIKTHNLCSVTFSFSKIMSFMEKRGKILYNRTGHRWKSGACVFHAGCLILHSQKMQYLLLFQCKNGCRNGASKLRYTYSACLLLHYLVKGTIVGKKIIEQKYVLLFSLQLTSTNTSENSVWNYNLNALH